MGKKTEKFLRCKERLCWLTHCIPAEHGCNWNILFAKFIGSWCYLLPNWSINLLLLFFNELGDFLEQKPTRKPDQMPRAQGTAGLFLLANPIRQLREEIDASHYRWQIRLAWKGARKAGLCLEVILGVVTAKRVTRVQRLQV